MKALYLAYTAALGLGLAVSAPVALAAPAQTAPSVPASDVTSAHFNNIAREQRIVADWTRLTSLPDTATTGNTATGKSATPDPADHTAFPDPPTTANLAREQRIMADWTRLTSLPERLTAPAENVTANDTASR